MVQLSPVEVLTPDAKLAVPELTRIIASLVFRPGLPNVGESCTLLESGLTCIASLPSLRDVAVCKFCIAIKNAAKELRLWMGVCETLLLGDVASAAHQNDE